MQPIQQELLREGRTPGTDPGYLKRPRYRGRRAIPERTVRSCMETYEFTCPDCGGRFVADEPTLEAMVTNGCPLCGGSVTTDDFVGVDDEAVC